MDAVTNGPDRPADGVVDRGPDVLEPAPEGADDEVAGRVWTIGHWTCPPDLVLDTLASVGVDLVVDVRRMPGSRRSPQFDAENMTQWLADGGVDYLHLPALAGRRPRQPDVDPTRNAGWQNVSFKNYADYTLTPPFEDGLRELTDLADTRHVAVLCGEPMPWRCHRLLIANTLVARGRAVEHLMTNAAPRPHRLGQWGADPVVSPDGIVTYPAPTDPSS
ncbi:DUF488 domain-containing protein [Agilicoccus flavus]|uniref:DUF488 domain-containing protein n=1 Tax=Agilicoccus flavus TaxID=2775968 RepID=UPI001CF6DC32|nr:DUF488 domain-containing protein [Agilicoccus flavus]